MAQLTAALAIRSISDRAQFRQELKTKCLTEHCRLDITPLALRIRSPDVILRSIDRYIAALITSVSEKGESMQALLLLFPAN